MDEILYLSDLKKQKENVDAKETFHGSVMHLNCIKTK